MVMTSKKIILGTLIAALVVPLCAFAQTNTDSAGAEKMRRAKQFAEQEIERRIHALASTTDKVNSLDRVSEKFKMDLRAKLQAEMQTVQGLRTKIQEGEDPAALKRDVEAVNKNHHTFALVVPKAHIAAAAEKIVTITAIMGEMGVKLKNRITAAEAEGKDVSALLEALASLSTHIDVANAHAQAAVDGTAMLEPDNGDQTVFEANKVALKAARANLATAHQEIQAGRADIKLIADAFKPATEPVEDTPTPSVE